MFLSMFSDHADVSTIVFRFGVSFLLSFLVGLEREWNSQPAGLRTHVLISVGATMFMLLSIRIPHMFDGKFSSDPARIAAQIVTGIGFLGAGAIIKIGINVKGLTTAANVWVVSAIGMAVGAGYYIPAFIITVITLITLTILNLMEKALIKGRQLKNLYLKFESTRFYLDQVTQVLEQFEMKITTIDFSESNVKGVTEMDIGVRIPGNADIQSLFSELRKLPEIVRIDLSQL
jgi:putative Mg2+ transporter-C (MgtC) family protein